MTVIGVGEIDGRDMLFVSGNTRLGQCKVHETLRSHQAIGRKTRRIGDEVLHPFVMDRIGPARVEQAVDRRLHDDVPQMKRVQDTGIADRDDGIRCHSGG